MVTYADDLCEGSYRKIDIFRAKKLRDIYLNMTDQEKEILTDACKIMVLKGEQVKLVEGDVTNIKITYPSDIRMAESLMGGE